MEKINKLVLNNFLAYGECNLFHHGFIIDTMIYKFDYSFSGGKIYGVIDEFGNGSTAFSYALTGKTMGKYGHREGQIIINEKQIVNASDLLKYTCYAGEDAGLKKKFSFKEMTVKEQIEYGIKNGTSLSSNPIEIKNKFCLSDERWNRKTIYLSGEHWKASLAIGYALGKIIYCFPWLNTRELKFLQKNITPALIALIDIGAIIIIPTPRKEVIESFPVPTMSLKLNQNDIF